MAESEEVGDARGRAAKGRKPYSRIPCFIFVPSSAVADIVSGFRISVQWRGVGNCVFSTNPRRRQGPRRGQSRRADMLKKRDDGVALSVSLHGNKIENLKRSSRLRGTVLKAPILLVAMLVNPSARDQQAPPDLVTAVQRSL